MSELCGAGTADRDAATVRLQRDRAHPGGPGGRGAPLGAGAQCAERTGRRVSGGQAETPPRVPWGMVERRVGQHALRGATLQSTQASQNRDEDRLTGWSFRGPKPRERCTICTPAEERWTPAQPARCQGRERPGGRVRPAADGRAGPFRPERTPVLPESLVPSGLVPLREERYRSFECDVLRPKMAE